MVKRYSPMEDPYVSAAGPVGRGEEAGAEPCVLDWGKRSPQCSQERGCPPRVGADSEESPGLRLGGALGTVLGQ